jgi:hypothetical protein
MEPGAPADICRHPLDVIRWERVIVDLAQAGDMDAMLERFSETLQRKMALHDPLPVIARVECVGQTDLHHRLVSDPEHLKQIIRSTALAAFGDRAWIEKVMVKTASPARETADAGPLRELSLVVGELIADADKLMALGEELAMVFQKLPADYRLGESRIHPGDPMQMRELVEQAHALLVRRLRKEDGQP